MYHPIITNRVKIFTTLLLLVLLSCGIAKIDLQKARTLVEQLLNDLKQENYSSLDQYYTSSFNESEPLEKKAEKFRQLKVAMGAIKSFELTSSKVVYDADKGINQAELKYKVTCERVVVEETYLVINDEGALKIIFQNIENLK